MFPFQMVPTVLFGFAILTLAIARPLRKITLVHVPLRIVDYSVHSSKSARSSKSIVPSVSMTPVSC